MIPIRLKISGFLSYQQPVEVDFNELALACISGQNGAGKSSLLDAITWALFGQARRKDDTVINSRAEAAEVILDFDYENSRYRVQRSKPRNKSTILEFSIQDPAFGWRPLTEHSLRQTEERIIQTLRMDYETFTNASFFLQGKADQFAQQRPGDRKRILSNILGLEKWETYREEAAERRKQCEREIATLDGQIQEIDAELNQENERREKLAYLENELSHLAESRAQKENTLEMARLLNATLESQRQQVARLSSQLSAARQRISQHQDQLKERQDEEVRYQQQLTAEQEILQAYQHWQQLRQKLEQQETIAEQYRTLETNFGNHRNAIEAERSRLEAEKNSLQQRKAEIIVQAEKLPAVAVQIEQLNGKLAQLNQLSNQRESFNEELREWATRKTEAETENRALRQEMTILKERIEQLKVASGAVCPLCGQPLSDSEREQHLITLEAEGKLKGDRYRINQAAIQQAEEQAGQIQRQVSELSKVDAEMRQTQASISDLQARSANIQQQVEAWENSFAPRLNELESILLDNRYAQNERRMAEEIQKQMLALGYNSTVHSQIRQEEQSSRRAEDQYRLLESARAALVPLQREIKNILQQIETGQADILTLNQEWEQASGRLQTDSANLPDLATLETDVYSLKSQENQLRLKIGSARQQVDVLDTQRAKKSDYSAKRAEFQAQTARLKLLEKAFGKDGVPALLIEQALPEIEAQANEFLDRLSNGAMSITFATQRDYRDRSREDKKETLDILISDASGPREYELFSGGEAFRVNFAIRLALSRVLAKRAGARLQTLVIDEGFGSQDSDGRQRLIEAINLVQADFARILVITHLEELKDAFPARIEVEKTAAGSRVRVLTS